MFSSTLYKKSPIWLQEWLISIRGFIRKTLLEDGVFKALLAELEISQFKSAAQITALQKDKLTSVLKHAAKNTPYYQHLSQQTPFSFSEPFETLTQLPIINKNNVLDDPEAFIATNIPKWRHLKNFTSGTTGTPFRMLQTLHSHRQEYAFVRRQMQWSGYKAGDKIATIRGDLVVPTEVTTPPFWRLNRSENTLILSSYHFSNTNAASYIDALRQFNPVLIQAYPSSIAFLANWLLQTGQSSELTALKGIMTSSETLLDEHRENIELAFGVKVFDWYGSVERVAAIGTCEAGRYHIIEDYGYTELNTDEKGAQEIIGTSFQNSLMPLIRYGTLDLIEPEAPDVQCACNRSFRLVKRIFGRMNDVIKTPNGRIHGVVTQVFKKVPDIYEGQILQTSISTIEMHVVTSGNKTLSKTSKNQLIRNLQERIGSSITITVIQVDSIPRTQKGKFIYVVNQLL